MGLYAWVDSLDFNEHIESLTQYDTIGKTRPASLIEAGNMVAHG